MAPAKGLLGKFLTPPMLMWAGALAAVVALLVVGTGVVLASGSSLPGQSLYPVKRGTENVRLVLTSSDAGKANLHIALAGRRAKELAMVAPVADPERIADLSQEINHNLGEALRLAASATDGKKVVEFRDRLERSAHTHLALLEGSLDDVPEGSRAAFNDAFQLSSKSYGQGVETAALRAPASLLTSMGFLQLRASDPPAPDVDNVFVDVCEIEVFLAAGSGSWITIVDSCNAFDLLRVAEINLFLVQQEIPAGTYTQICFEIDKAFVVAEGKPYIAEVPDEKLCYGSVITVQDGETTIITIDFIGQESVWLTDEGHYILTPEVNVLVDGPLNKGDESSSHHHQASGEKMEMEIKGVIESFSTTIDSNTQLVVVGGLTLEVTPKTKVDGILSEGVYVEAEVVEEPDGSYTVVELEVKDEDEERRSRLTKVEIEGTIDAIDGDIWTVAGHTVYLTGEATWDIGGDSVTVTTNAEIDGYPQVGYTAEVEGWLSPDGSLLALEIEVDDDGEEGENRGEHATIELSGIIDGLYRTQGDIASLSEQDLEGSDWAGDVTVTLADGTTFYINEHTEIEGTLENGREVEVEMGTDADGAQYAIEIEVDDDKKEENKDSGN